jgi:hypothetical protein
MENRPNILVTFEDAELFWRSASSNRRYNESSQDT